MILKPLLNPGILCHLYFLVDSDVMEGLKKMFKVGQEKKELVDPYVQLSFAGKQVGTEANLTNW